MQNETFNPHQSIAPSAQFPLPQWSAKTRAPKTEYERSFGATFGEYRKNPPPPREFIIHCLGRGDIATLNAVTNVGKTTYLRNLMISLCTGQDFSPLTVSAEPLKVAFLDFEDSESGMYEDLSTMVSKLSESDQDLFDQNALIFCNARDQDGIEFILSDESAFDRYREGIIKFGADLIIVDTISSAFSIECENDNAEVKKRVMTPLARLAKLCNAALIATHHIGKAKAEDGHILEASHRGRGASSFGDHSWLNMNLIREAATGDVILYCGKAKGPAFDETVLRLDPVSRWFTMVASRKAPSKYAMFMDVFEDGKPLHWRTIVKALNDVCHESTAKRLRDRALFTGELVKVEHGRFVKSPKV